MIKITHSHGLTERADDYEQALEQLRSVYGDEIETEGDIDDPLSRVLVWRDEESAKNDDGQRAVAFMKKVFPDTETLTLWAFDGPPSGAGTCWPLGETDAATIGGTLDDGTPPTTMTVRTSDRAALIERVADWATARMKEARYAKGETVTVVIADDDGVHLHREEIGLIPE